MSDQLLINETSCARLMVRASYFADRHEIEQFVALFTKDGVVERLGEAFTGADAIRGFMQRRPRNRVTRHMLTPPVIELTGAHQAHGCTFFTLYDGIGADDEVLPLSAPVVVGEFHQTYHRVGGIWKIARHSVKGVFRPAAKEAK